ncbi:Protein of unknown function, DUF255 [Pedobacter sp. ok626]|uniref:thioredoxin family protein n=1 Tax=Pedobacter sp. ok626 TaxID=1761882 RepID=UPI0008844B80|nr:DUF255 domain-containing protein [Pedobacter sp. ok626]SDK65769.1 Protein of unknown function, DUF255 [Pedobacter sp. ok626]
MKKIIIAMITLCAFNMGVKAQQEGKSIMFVQGTLSDVLSQAKKANKLVFIDCYTSWCGPCKMMEKHVFTNDTVGSFFNQTFINYKMDMEKGEGPDVGKLYRVISYPTYLFLDGDGKVVHRSGGRMPTAEFIGVAKKAANPAETSLAIEQRYAAGERSPEFLLKYIAVLKKSIPRKAETLYNEQLATVSDEVLKTDLGWDIIKLYPLNEGDRLYQFLIANKAHFVSKYGKEEIREIEKQVELKALYKTLAKMEKEELFKRLAAYRQGADATMLGTAGKIELLYYFNIKDYPTFLKLAKQYSASILKVDDDALSFIARKSWSSTDDKAVLEQGLAMAKQAVMINDKSYPNQRTLADVYYKIGLKEEAMKAAQSALKIANEENPKAAKLTEELIEKIKAM